MNKETTKSVKLKNETKIKHPTSDRPKTSGRPPRNVGMHYPTSGPLFSFFLGVVPVCPS